MNLHDILSESRVLPNLRSGEKEAVLRELAEGLCAHCAELEGRGAEIFEALCARERLGSTGVGEGVAIPHAKIPRLESLVACFARSQTGVAFESIDQQRVRLFFVLLVPENSTGAHLKALARISRLLKRTDFRTRLLELGDAKAVYKAIIDADSQV